MGAACMTASVLTLCSNVLYMFRGWEAPLPFYDWASNSLRWMTSQIWYAIGMIFLFHVVTRPAQSGVVLFVVLYIPVHFLLLRLCDIYRESKHILIPLEIVVDVLLYNGPFLVLLLRLLYWAWKVAYDEAILTGAIYIDEEASAGNTTPSISRFFFLGSDDDCDSRPGTSTLTATARPGTSGYIGLTMVDLDEVEQGQSRVRPAATGPSKSRSGTKPGVTNNKTIVKSSSSSSSNKGEQSLTRDMSLPKLLISSRLGSRGSSRNIPKTLPKTSSPLRNVVIFNVDSSDEDGDEDEDEDDDSDKDNERPRNNKDTSLLTV
ncbi:hypothetical protein BGZ94_004251 [Podila epigama]|nr:hypothetical protein BGZ94_004251 [Podila epigama]